MKLYTSIEAAAVLGVEDSRIRQICIALWGDGDGRKFGRVWHLTSSDLRQIKAKTRIPAKVKK